MQGQEITDDYVDKSHWVEWSKTDPLLKPERRAKGDIRIDTPCPDCESLPAPERRSCRTCKGKQRVRAKDPASLGEQEIRYAQAVVWTTVNHLYYSDVISDQNVHDGHTYEIWQTIFRARLGYRNSLIWGEELRRMHRLIADDDLEYDDFGKLIRSLGERHCRAVEFAIYTPVTPHIRWLIARTSNPYQEAFTRLTSVMERLREEWRRKQDEKNGLREA